MSTTVQVTFDAADPGALAAFWVEALHYAYPAPPGVPPEPGEDPRQTWQRALDLWGVPEAERNRASAIEDPDGVGPRIFFQHVPEAKTVKNRMHLDLRVASGLSGDERMNALEAECARLVALGADRVQRHDPQPPMSHGFIVMQDPEGNEFCLD
ncbi:MAG: VOC family protein [Actinomycetales bacterium]